MTRISASFLLLLTGLFVALPLRAQEARPCDQTILDTLGEFLGVKNFRVYTYGDKAAAVVAATCKPWPKDRNIMLVTAAYDLPNDQHPDDVGAAKPFVVAMVDTSRQSVISSFKDEIGQDATLQVIGDDSVKLDTARYDLAPGIRAFGVVLYGASAPHCVDGWYHNYLILFVRERMKLRPVFMAPLDQWNTVKGEVCSNLAVTDDAHLTISVGKSRSHGFADLSVNAHVTRDTMALLSSGEPKSVPDTIRIERNIVHYDGRKYVMPHDSIWLKGWSPFYFFGK